MFVFMKKNVVHLGKGKAEQHSRGDFKTCLNQCFNMSLGGISLLLMMSGSALERHPAIRQIIKCQHATSLTDSSEHKKLIESKAVANKRKRLVIYRPAIFSHCVVAHEWCAMNGPHVCCRVTYYCSRVIGAVSP